MNITDKITKGKYGYIDAEKKKVILQTIIFYAISAAIFVIGYVTTGSEKNLLTVVAVLGMLPSSKSAVRMIMFLKTPKFSKNVSLELAQEVCNLDCVYTLVLTAYEGTYPISCIAVRDHNVCAFTEFSKCKADAFEEHVKKMLQQSGYANMTVKLLYDQKKFINRALQLKELPENGKEKEILQLLCDISL